MTLISKTNTKQNKNNLEIDQFQHPGAPPAGGKAAKEPEQHDGDASSCQDVGSVGGAVGDQQHVGAQHELPPQAHCQEGHTCHLRGKVGSITLEYPRQTKTK